MCVTFVGTGFPIGHDYADEERQCWKSIIDQIESLFPQEKNLLISLTWFGPQFDNDGWDTVMQFSESGIKYDNLFLLATVDPPYLDVTALQEVKNMVQALRVYYLGNFDSPHQFNFFAPIISEKFVKYTPDDVRLESVKNIFVNYNRKPKPHRVEFVKKLLALDLTRHGIVTLGRDQEHVHDQDPSNDLYLSIGESHEKYLDLGNRPAVWAFDIPQDYYSLHRMDVWNNTFLYINGATEFNPINDLFCQQDTFKPMIGLRPFVINGVQKTYRWLRNNGFCTFNHYWPHIDIENGDVHDTLIKLIQHLSEMPKIQLMEMHHDMMPLLLHNKERFFEFAQEQNYRIRNLFK